MKKRSELSVNGVPIRDIRITGAEAALLSRGRMETPFHPKSEADQVGVCALAARGLMTINGPYHRDNRCFTTFSGAYALAGWAGTKEAKRGKR